MKVSRFVVWKKLRGGLFIICLLLFVSACGNVVPGQSATPPTNSQSACNACRQPTCEYGNAFSRLIANIGARNANANNSLADTAPVAQHLADNNFCPHQHESSCTGILLYVVHAEHMELKDDV